MSVSTGATDHYALRPIPSKAEASGSDTELSSSEKAQNDFEDDVVPSRMTSSTVLAVIALAAAVVGTNVAGFFSGAIISYVVEDFGVDRADGEWLQISGSVLYACTAPIVGYLSDLYGRRNALLSGVIANIIGTIIIAVAPNFAAAIAGHVIVGIGNAVAELTGTAAIAELVPIRKRGLFLALATLLTLPFIPSVLYGEVIASQSTWRWCYAIAIFWNGLSFMALMATYFRLNFGRPDRQSRAAAWRQIDYVGIFLVVAGTVLLIVGLENGGAQVYPWSSADTLAPLLTGIALLIVLLLWEWKGATEPLIPFRLFKGSRAVGLVFGLGFLGAMYYVVVDSLGALIFTEVFAASPLEAGLYALGPSIGLFIGATGFNVLLSLFRGAAREITAVAAVMAVAFTGALASANPDAVAQYLVLASFGGIGYGGLLEPATTIASIACPQDLIGTTISLVAFIRSIGGVVGYAIFASVALGKGSVAVPQSIGTAVVEAGLNPKEVSPFIDVLTTQGLAAAAKLPGVTPAILKSAGVGSQWGYWTAYQTMFYSQIPFGVLAVLLCIALPNIGKLMTDKVVTKAV